eukprot:gene56960-78061_t
MDARLAGLRGLARSNPQITAHRMEMTRWSMQPLRDDTGVTVFDVQRRMTDFGIDAFWLSHEPWVVPEPFTPEAGEMWSKNDIDRWIDTLAAVIAEAYTDPDRVRSAPHNQAIHKLDGAGLNDPSRAAVDTSPTEADRNRTERPSSAQRRAGCAPDRLPCPRAGRMRRLAVAGNDGLRGPALQIRPKVESPLSNHSACW